MSLELQDKWPWYGTIEIITQYLDGRIEIERFNNSVMDVAKNMIRDALKSSIPMDLKIKYCALGSGTTSVLTSQTQLASEQFRQQVTQQASGTTGVTTTTTYISPYDATSFTINEIGWFAGPNAGSSVNSGIMVARVLYTRAKTNLESLTITRTDTFA